MPNVTIRDVAREAAVSVASASRALNGHPSVHPETRARIVEAAERLRYVPHAGARSLSLARAHAIGVVLPDLHGEFFSEIVRGMDREATALGYQLLLSNMHADPRQAALALATMRGRVDGLLLMAPHIDPDLIVANLPRALPAVLLNNVPHDQPYPALTIENRAGARTMVRHLVATGCRRIVHLAGPTGNLDADERREGFLAAMAEAGLADQAGVIEGDFNEEGGAAAAATLLAKGDLPDAVFAANDMMAIGCLLAFREAGVVLPDQISLAGFDDIPTARYVSPGLTTLRVNIAELGARAVRLLIESLGDAPPEPENIHFAPELVVRATTRPLPRDA